jgi:hypothetical protein
MDGVGVGEQERRRGQQVPAVTALFLPVQPAGRGLASMTLTAENDVAISRVRSVEWSSTTMISKETPVWETRDWRQSASDASSLRAGTITETSGCAGSVSFVTIEEADKKNLGG